MARSRLLKRNSASFGAMPRMPARSASPAPNIMSIAHNIGQAAAPTQPMASHVPLISPGRMPYVQGYSVVNLLRQPGFNNPAFVGAPQDPTAPSSANYVSPTQQPAQAAPATPDTSGGGGDTSQPAPAQTDDGSYQDPSQQQPQQPPDAYATYADGYQDQGYQDQNYGYPQQQAYPQGGWYGYTPDYQQQPNQGYADAPPPDPNADPGVQSAAYYGDPQPERLNPFPLVNSHVRNGHLRTMALLNTPDGMIPLTASVPIFGCDVCDGFVRFGSDVQPPGVDGAVMATRQKLLQEANREQVRLQCESLVRRARTGDQNATALLAEMAENAKKGDPRARLAYSFTRTYIQRNPAGADVGAEGGGRKQLSYWTAVTLANGAPLSNARLAQLAGSLPRPEDVQIFLHGMTNFQNRAALGNLTKSMEESKARILDLGRMVGEARALQMARLPGVPLRNFDPAVAWEFGE